MWSFFGPRYWCACVYHRLLLKGKGMRFGVGGCQSAASNIGYTPLIQSVCWGIIFSPNGIQHPSRVKQLFLVVFFSLFLRCPTSMLTWLRGWKLSISGSGHICSCPTQHTKHAATASISGISLRFPFPALRDCLCAVSSFSIFHACSVGRFFLQ